MRYIPNTEKSVKTILKEIGVGSVEDLFSSVIPKELELGRELNIPRKMSEPDLIRHLKNMASSNATTDNHTSFLGAGAYNHYIPSIVGHLLSRSEFYSAYTPFQPEISQGTLQAIFEFQTMICQLTDMDVANASMYDGASSLAEAVLMAARITKKREVFLSKAIHPEYRRTVKTYTQFLEFTIREIPITEEGKTDLEWLQNNISSNTAAIALQTPNFFGTVEHIDKAKEIIDQNVILIGVVSEPVSLGVLKPPGSFGADIVVGEGQSFGNPISFGGPGLGFYASQKKYVRNMPGRLVGETEDAKGNRGYVLTLSTREQHIRREKATSNICSNHSLCALAATIHLSLLGKNGIRQLALLNLQKAAYAKKRLQGVKGCVLKFDTHTFNEFVIEFPISVEEVNLKLLSKGIIGGLELERFYPELKNCTLFCITELTRKEDIDNLADTIAKVL